LGCILIAFPVSQFYNEPKLIWLIPIVGFNTIIDGFLSTSLATLNRHMEIDKITLFELTSQIISIVSVVVWAWFSPTIWALVGGTFITAIAKLYLSHRLNPGKANRLAWNQEVIQEISTFGKWIFLSTATTFLASQADRLICGKLLSLSMLGVYTVAFNLASLPKQV
jgi:O-antigen/teichoic acid export membrane protein